MATDPLSVRTNACLSTQAGLAGIEINLRALGCLCQFFLEPGFAWRWSQTTGSLTCGSEARGAQGASRALADGAASGMMEQRFAKDQA